jgi:hypothetical protein
MSDGPTDAVVQRYLAYSWAAEEGQLRATGDARRWGSGEIRIVDVELLDKEGRERQIFELGEPLTVVLHYESARRIEKPVFGLAIHRGDGVHITGPNTRFGGVDIPYVEGRGKVLYEMASLPLLEGVYALSVAITNAADTKMYDYHDRLYPFRVRASVEEEQYGLVTLGGHWTWHLS